MATVIVRQLWLKSWQNGNNATLQSGTEVFTPAQGSALIAVQTAWDTTRQVPLPTDCAGLFVTPTNGAIHSTDAGVGFWATIGYQQNVNAVPHKIYPAYILDGVGGQNGEQNLWILEVVGGLPAGTSIRDCVSQVLASSRTSWSMSTGSTPQVNDLCISVTLEENSASFANAAMTTTWTSFGTVNDGTNNLPTSACYTTVGSAGVQTVTYGTADTGKTYDAAVTLTIPTSTSTLAFTTSPVATTATVKGFATFTCAVSGATGTAHYQWYVNGVAVGTDSSTLYYQPGLTETLSTVTVTVTDNLGAIYSTPVNLRVFRM